MLSLLQHMVQTGMASPYPTPQFPQNGEALAIKAESGGGGGSIGSQMKEGAAAGPPGPPGPPVPAYSPPVSAAAVSGAPVNGIEQQTVSIVSTGPGTAGSDGAPDQTPHARLRHRHRHASRKLDIFREMLGSIPGVGDAVPRPFGASACRGGCVFSPPR